VLHKFLSERLALTFIDGDLRERFALVSRGLGESGMRNARADRETNSYQSPARDQFDACSRNFHSVYLRLNLG
jgi:hypothetical protein